MRIPLKIGGFCKDKKGERLGLDIESWILCMYVLRQGLAVSPRRECNGLIPAQCNLHFLYPSDFSVSASQVARTSGTCHHVGLIFCIVEAGSHHVALADLEFLSSDNLPVLGGVLGLQAWATVPSQNFLLFEAAQFVIVGCGSPKKGVLGEHGRVMPWARQHSCGWVYTEGFQISWYFSFPLLLLAFVLRCTSFLPSFWKWLSLKWGQKLIKFSY